jgi:hypothetical protein
MDEQIWRTRLASRRLQHVMGQLAEGFYKPPYPKVINPYDGNKNSIPLASQQYPTFFYNGYSKQQTQIYYVDGHINRVIQHNQLLHAKAMLPVGGPSSYFVCTSSRTALFDDYTSVSVLGYMVNNNTNALLDYTE